MGDLDGDDTPTEKKFVNMKLSRRSDRTDRTDRTGYTDRYTDRTTASNYSAKRSGMGTNRSSHTFDGDNYGSFSRNTEFRENSRSFIKGRSNSMSSSGNHRDKLNGPF